MRCPTAFRAFYDRLNGLKAQAKVMIALLTKAFFHSMACLGEVSAAIDQGLDRVPWARSECFLSDPVKVFDSMRFTSGKPPPQPFQLEEVLSKRDRPNLRVVRVGGGQQHTEMPGWSRPTTLPSRGPWAPESAQ